MTAQCARFLCHGHDVSGRRQQLRAVVGQRLGEGRPAMLVDDDQEVQPQMLEDPGVEIVSDELRALAGGVLVGRVPLCPVDGRESEVLAELIDTVMQVAQVREPILGFDLEKLVLDELTGDEVLASSQQQKAGRHRRDHAVAQASRARESR